jgi:hypothetical protein
MAVPSPAHRPASLILPWLAVGAATVAALLSALAGFGSRFGWWHFRSGFALLKYAAYGGLCAAVLAVVAGLVCCRQRRATGIVLSFLALAGGLAVTAVPVSWRIKARQLPVIHDITTDTLHPPQFVAILPLRKDAPNPSDYGGTLVAEQQKKAYADLRTEVLDSPSSQAFERALAAARAMGWRIVAADPAQGRIEACATTFWFGFVDDIVIRTAAAGERTLVDVRSVSRVGKSDVGTNAKRIRNYLHRLRVSP